MSETAFRNPIVAALSRASMPDAGTEALPQDASLDDLPTPDEVPIPLLPADSSQLRALAFAKGRNHLVIHGPPGTGKSQTISSLIADALGRNERVLFVSAKIAALDVVFKRLAELGLGRFCLEAHSTKAGKTKIIDELRRTLTAEEISNPLSLTEDIERLVRTRQQLNGYVQDLHRAVTPLGLTPFKAIGRLARLLPLPDIRFPLPWADPSMVGRSELAAVLDALAEIETNAAVFESREHHPWRGFVSTTTGVIAQQSVESDLNTVSRTIDEIYEAMEALSGLLQFGDRISFDIFRRHAEGLEAVFITDRFPVEWWKYGADELFANAELFEEASKRVAEIESKTADYRAIMALPFAEGRALLLPVETNFEAWHRRVSPAYLRWRSTVKRHLQPGVSSDFRSLRSYYLLATRLAALNAWVIEHEEILAPEVGEEIYVSRTLKAAAQRFRTACLLKRALSERGVEPLEGSEISDRMKESSKQLLRILPAGNSPLAKTLDNIDTSWPRGFAEGHRISQVAFDAIKNRIGEILSAPHKMNEWSLIQRVIDKCDGLGLAPFLAMFGTTPAGLARAAFERRFLILWVDAAISRAEHLKTFSGIGRNQQIQRFQELDERLRRLSLAHTKATASGSARLIKEARSDLGSASEVGVLRYELGKKRKIKPLRKLFGEIPHVLQALKPCMLMSPLSVSTFLKPGTFEFDTVVFDEASQLPTAEAVPSILRAKQVVVAGDANQLPPTSFFASMIFLQEDGEDDSEEQFEPLESLLDDCVAIVPKFREVNLRWHYRSRDERLIKFSNHYIYENHLITFPSATVNDEGRGVRLAYVADGVWDRGRSRTNRPEARRVAELVIEQLTKYPHRSLGVVAMNVQQREAIEDAISERLVDRPDIVPLLTTNRHEPYFVKSLENVQGDERDTMIISVGYGRDPNGSLTLNFGPLNMEGGWRRLNVLVTRAKWQTILVTSLRSHELQGVNPLNRGAVTLRDYIEYAERGGNLPRERPIRTEAETNDFEDSIYQALTDRSLSVHQQVGASSFRVDLAIRHRKDPTRYALGVECDGATYHAARSARDRDVLRQEILRGMGWRIHRVWSTDWFRDPEKEITAILNSLEHAESKPFEDLPEVPIDFSPFESTDAIEPVRGQESSHPRRYPPGIPYQAFTTRNQTRDREVLLNSINLNRLARDIRAIVSAEGPINEDLLAARLKELHNVERLGINVQSNIHRGIEWAVQNFDVQRFEHRFLKLKDTFLKTFRFPGDIIRPISLIPHEELQLAILHLVEEQLSVFKDYIPTAVSRLFGLDRTGADAADSIKEVVESLIDNGRLRSSGFQVYLP